MERNNNFFSIQLVNTFNLSLFAGLYLNFDIFTLIALNSWRPSWKYAN